ncbi:MAG: hypothetical protein JO332_04490, partial [Planctomycetaceae bacterium]|nr:hypothetical protein [Planctomycetaceae bacterium]
MGQEILYCYKCQTRLLGSEFEKGKAFKVGAQASCKNCVKDLLGSVPDAAYETDRGRKLQSTARIPVQATESGSGKWKPATVRAAAPAPPPPPKGKPVALIAGLIGLVAVLLLLGIALNSNSSSRRNDPPPPSNSAPPQPPVGGTAPAPPPSGFAAELREIDEKMRAGLAAEDFKSVSALLAEA